MSGCRAFAVALLIGMPASPALAATCRALAGGAPAAELAACETELADTEADLAKAFRRVRAQTPMEARHHLAKAQQAWLAHRAAQCVRDGGASPGVLNVATLSCTAAMNRNRIEALEEELLRGE